MLPLHILKKKKCYPYTSCNNFVYIIQVADFGLTKLAEVGNASLPTRGIVGTFGYMPPEYVLRLASYSNCRVINISCDQYSIDKPMVRNVCRYAQYGDVSRKVDVFAFGVVLYELISAKEAIVRSTESGSSMGLVYLITVMLNQLVYVMLLVF